METMVTARIDVSRPIGRRLVKELETHRKVVVLHYPVSKDISGIGYSLEESYNKGIEKLSASYGVDFRTI